MSSAGQNCHRCGCTYTGNLISGAQLFCSECHSIFAEELFSNLRRPPRIPSSLPQPLLPFSGTEFGPPPNSRNLNNVLGQQPPAASGSGHRRRNFLNVDVDAVIQELQVNDLPDVEVNNEISELECPVCRSVLGINGMVVTRLPCNHLYHRVCIRAWFKSNYNCPLCRFELSLEDPAGNHQNQMNSASGNQAAVSGDHENRGGSSSEINQAVSDDPNIGGSGSEHE